MWHHLYSVDLTAVVTLPSDYTHDNGYDIGCDGVAHTPGNSKADLGIPTLELEELRDLTTTEESIQNEPSPTQASYSSQRNRELLDHSPQIANPPAKM
jgi:hypothetical protein